MKDHKFIITMVMIVAAAVFVMAVLYTGVVWSHPRSQNVGPYNGATLNLNQATQSGGLRIDTIK